MGLGEGGRNRATAMVYLVGSPSHKSLAGCVSALIASCFAQLRRVEATGAASVEQVEHLSSEPPRYQRTRAVRHAHQARQAERQARYEQITALQKPGMKSAESAAVVGMNERTVRHWQERGDIPYSGPR